MITGAESFSVKHAPARHSVASHPAFQLFVAAWFAALLGVGSLMVPAALIQRMVAISGMAALVPAAAPPLGFTARATLALVGAIAGTGAGLFVARKFAQSSRPETKVVSMPQEAPRCRPIHASEELHEEGIAQTAWGDSPQEHIETGAPGSEKPASTDERPGHEHPHDERLDAMPPGSEQSFDHMGLMQLTARLGAALHKRRNQLAAEQAAVSRSASAPVAGGADLKASGAEEAAQAVADFFSPAKGANSLPAPASQEVH